MLENSFTDAQIIDRCRDEREKRSSLNKGDEFACLELLRRAIVLWSPEAFEAVNEFYGRQFISWIIGHYRYQEFCNYVPYLNPEDVVQDAYVKLHRALSKRDDFQVRFRTVAYFMAFCRGAISNCVNDHLPRRRKTVSPTPAETDNTNISESPARQDFAPSSIEDDDAVTDEDRHFWASVDQSLDWEQITDHVKQILPEDKFEIFMHKIQDRPTLENLLESGKTREDIRKLWRSTLAKLYSDPKLRKMLGM